MPNPPILTVSAELVDRLVDALLDGSPVGAAAAEFIRSKKDTLVGIGLDAFKNFIGSLGTGSKSDLYKARVALIDSMSWDETLVIQEQSSAAAEQHASEKVRLGVVLNTVAQLAVNIVPKLATVVVALI